MASAESTTTPNVLKEQNNDKQKRSKWKDQLMKTGSNYKREQRRGEELENVDALSVSTSQKSRSVKSISVKRSAGQILIDQYKFN